MAPGALDANGKDGSPASENPQAEPDMKHALTSLAALMAMALPAAALAQDMMIHGGPIHTGVRGASVAEVVIVRDGRIAYAGDRWGAPEIAPGTPVMHLRGAALYPGFTDAHAHLSGIGARELTLNLEGAASIAEAMARLSAWAAAHPDGPITGRGWIETRWPEGRMLERGDLDAAAPGRVVLLIRADGHALAASTAALEAAGIAAGTEAPFGGDILKGPDGDPNGLLIDAAMGLVSDLRPADSPAFRRQAYEAGFAVYARYGWTGVHSMSVPIEDAPLMEAMAEAGQAPLRVYNSITPEGAEALFATGPRAAADGRVVTRAIKLYADGALGSRGAALFDPYADAPHTHGLMQMTGEDALPLYRAALAHGIQITTHAIGDRGNAQVLDWYAEVLAEAGPGADPRWRIEHAQVLRPADFARFHDIPVIASMQPSHAIGDLHFAPARLGDARLDGAYAWRALMDAGVTVVGGSDAPVERGDPLIEFYAAVARRDLSGFQGADWRPDQAVDRSDALYMFTLGPAWASFREDELGTIEVGKRADFTVFDIDLMTVPVEQIPQGRALMTVLDGRIAWRAQDW